MSGPTRAGSSVARRRVVAVLIVTTLAGYAGLLVRSPHLFSRWPFAMHYGYANKHVLAHGWAPVLPLVLSLALLAVVVARLWTRPRAFVIALFPCAVLLQLSWSLLDGTAAARISSTLLSKHYGHSEFVALAHDAAPPLQVARDYEHIAATDPRFVYAKSKPPGQLLFYALSVRLFRSLGLEAASRRAVEALGFFADSPYASFGPFATALFVSLSCSPVFVLYRLGSALGDQTVGAYLALSFVLTPALNLVTMHMDQVLYPVLAASVLYAVVLGMGRAPGYAAVAGCLTYASVYVSFSMLFLFPAIGLLLAGYGAWSRHGWQRVLAVGSVFGAGVVACAVVFYLALNFDPLPAFARASAHHRAWMEIEGLVRLRGNIHNLYEFAVWLGLPAVILYGAHCWRILAAPAEIRTPVAVLALGYPFVLLALSLFGGTEHEVGRLWIPFAVPALVPVARELSSLHDGRRPWLFVVVGVVMILLMKNYQDFQ
jgi:hypothetical protein